MAARRIFICYRREDAKTAGRLYDRLKAEFGPQGVFRDIDNRPTLGSKFRDYIEAELASCDFLLAPRPVVHHPPVASPYGPQPGASPRCPMLPKLPRQHCATVFSHELASASRKLRSSDDENIYILPARICRPAAGAARGAQSPAH